MITARPPSTSFRPSRFVILLVLSLLLISAAPVPPESVMIPPPVMPDSPKQTSVLTTAAARATVCQNCVYLPVVSIVPSVYLTRAVSLELYKQEYLGSKAPAVGWTGNYSPCNSGTTSAAFQTAVLRRINFYRTMVGVPPVKGLNPVYNHQDQEAAYMVSINKQYNPAPPTTWTCYSDSGAAGIKTANITMKAIGPDAIDYYMDDTGLDYVGHRRWILYPQTQQMGSGSVVGDGTHPKTDATHVIDDHHDDVRPSTRYPYVAWPPMGYVPYTLINSYWSLSYPNADFTNSVVTVTKGGTPVSITKYAQKDRFGENTVVWKFNDVNGDWPKPAADTTYTVKVTNVAGNTYIYDVTVFDPGQ